MRVLCSILGNLLPAAGLGGLALLAGGPPDAVTDAPRTRPAVVPQLVTGRPMSGEPDPRGGDVAPPDWAVAPTGADGPAPAPRAPISRVEIPAIDLRADVVPARLVARDGEATWEVPAFKAGHAEYTADAGEPGTALLLGHVGSRAAGAVFQHLDRVQAGDVIHVFSSPRRFDYRVVDARAVSPTDLAALRPTGVASLALVTCTGRWLPAIWDYTERLVVRAELAASTSPE